MTSSGAIFQRVTKGKGKGKREREIEFRWRKNVERIPYKNQHSGGGVRLPIPLGTCKYPSRSGKEIAGIMTKPVA